MTFMKFGSEAGVVLRMSSTALALVLAGCAVGPDFQRPAAPTVERYTAAALPAMAGDTQKLVDGADVSARWWTVFGSDALNALMQEALRNNPDLQAAEAALRGAQEAVKAQRAAYFPTVDLHLMPTRQSVAPSLASPAASGNTLYTLHTAQLNIAYTPDVFGGTRRKVESLAAQAEAQRFEREAAYLTLTSNIVAAVIQEASVRAQIEASERIVASAGRQLDMTRQLRVAGQAAAADVAAQEAALAQARAAMPALQKQLSQQRHLLAVLAGRFPSDDIGAGFSLASLTLPRQLPVSLPARLVEQRPDIRAAEAQWHAANAEIGVAKANRLPNFSITASGGAAGLDWPELLRLTGGFWNLGADIAAPLFDGGALRHQQGAAQAAADQAAAQYRSTVLTAFQNVADTLQAIHEDAAALEMADAAEVATRRSYAIAKRQWETGASNYLPVLVAEQAWRQAEIGLVQAQAGRYADTAALFQALGGGWWNRPAE